MDALHFFDGDGLVHALRFEDDRAWYQSRFVRDSCFLAEEAAGRYCLDGLNLKADDPLPEVGRVQHNTNIVHHAGRLFALVENGFPFELDPKTLAPIGDYLYDGKAVGLSTSAHPKIDRVTGQMVIHGYQPVEPFLSLYTVEPDGRVSIAETIDAPWPGMCHDLAITRDHVILPLGSIVFDVSVMAEGGVFRDALRWEPERGMKFGIRSRAAGSEIRWFDAPTPGFLFHPGNAYEEDGVITMDACTYLAGEGFLSDLATIRSGELTGGFVAVPFLYEFDLATGECRERQLTDRPAEFPRIDDRLIGQKNRWGYAVESRRKPASIFDSLWTGITRYDRTGGPSDHHPLPPGHWSSEPVFVPRSAEAAEDDGFVIAQIYDGLRGRSSFRILDARNLAGEPLATLWVRERMPLGFHGNFVSGAD
jgi:carotenoid cleavage dioxygenase